MLRKNIKAFDNNIKNISNVAYQRLNSDKFIAITRKWNYSLVPLLKVAYGIWVKKYEY